jgi:hypothetical protein
MKQVSVLIVAAAVAALALLPWAGGGAFHAPTHDLAITPADLTALGADAIDTLGASVAAGDFNGDGFEDLLVGADHADAAGNGKSEAGEAYVIFGDPALGGSRDIATGDQDLTVLGADANDYLGVSVAAGDVNGDGIDDLLIGAPYGDAAQNARTDTGEAYVIFGSPALGGTIDLAVDSPGLTVRGRNVHDHLGSSVGAGDFNGDGIDDLLVGADHADGQGSGTCPDGGTGDRCEAGEAYVVFGSPTLGGTVDLPYDTPGLAVYGADASDWLGEAVAAGDLNGDGIDDLLLGARGADAAGNAKESAGEAYVIFAIDSDSDGDGMPNSFELAHFCLDPLIDDSYEDPDFDGLANITEFGLWTDPCRSDTDEDTFSDSGDSCPHFPEDFDGFQDIDGCPDPDNDLDGICDAGMTSSSCSGEDMGQLVFDPAGTLPSPTVDCRNIAEDYDGFKDSDGCPEPDNDNDGFPDTTDACPGTDALAGADGMLGSPEDLNHNGVQDGAESPLTTDDSPFALSFEDYDGVLDTDGCHDSPGDDYDGDTFSDELEALFLGTDPAMACPLTSTANDEDPDPWPPDWDDTQTVDILDLLLTLDTDADTIPDLGFKKAFRTDMDGTPNEGGGVYHPRFDLDHSTSAPGGSPDINLLDLLPFKPFFRESCTP